MELHQLRCFQKVARLGNMTQAAKSLHVAQSSLSRSIAKLEREIGVPLLERTGRRIHLNQQGEVLLRCVESFLNDLDRVRRETTDLQEEAQGLVSLSASSCSSGYLLPRLLSSFRARYPGIRFQISTYRDTPHGRFAAFRQLEEGRTNLCLCPAEHERAPSTAWRSVITDELLLAVPSGHRLASSTIIRLCEVSDEPFICLRSQTSLRDLTDAMCLRAQFVPECRFEVEDLSLVRDLVAAGGGVALVPAGLERKCSEQSAPLLRLEGETTQWTVGVAWDRQYPSLSLAARLFRQFLVDFAGSDQAC